MEFLEDGCVTDETAAEVMEPPKEYNYTLEDFMGTVPYDALYEFVAMPFTFQIEVAKMAANAAKVGFKGFKGTLKVYMESKKAEYRRNMVPNQTEFDGPFQEMDCGEWHAADWGIYRENQFGNREYACSHAILPVERLVNIDTGEVKLKLAFKRPGKDKKWQTTIVGKDVISTSRTIVQLASQGISVTSSTASALVDYLNDIENRNYDVIPESKSIGRLGYIEGEGFSPFVEDLVFDGDASFRNLYKTVDGSHGSALQWCSIALECRAMSVTARILLAASFASPLLSVVGSLPFFVHLWGVDSGTGKTVALMLAASVWGNPAVGSYVQTFNGTQVGQERTAAFLNHLPMCLDELQLTKDSRGKSNFDVYQLAQGVGRSRGKRSGGVEMTPTWNCCFLTTGESPLTTVSSGAGAVNRVIDIECTAGTKVITDGHRIAGALKSSYGYAGYTFVTELYASEDNLQRACDLYQKYFRELCAGDSTEKQAMAAAAIITADELAMDWVFERNGTLRANKLVGAGNDDPLTVAEISEFLASREAVSAGRRAYDWLCDWVASNVNHFNTDDSPAVGDLYGTLEGNMAYIIRGVFDRVVQDAGFSTSATLSYLRSNCLIETRAGKGYTKTKRIGRTTPQCVWLTLAGEYDTTDDDMLPL